MCAHLDVEGALSSDNEEDCPVVEAGLIRDIRVIGVIRRRLQCLAGIERVGSHYASHQIAASGFVRFHFGSEIGPSGTKGGGKGRGGGDLDRDGRRVLCE